MRHVAAFLIRLYQWTVSPLLGPRCRFHPSCSQYALDAIERFGVVRGTGLGLWRLLRCNPWNHGGYDPVPEALRPFTSRIAPMNTSVLGNLRFYLWAALALVLFYDYEAWMKDYGPAAAGRVRARPGRRRESRAPRRPATSVAASRPRPHRTQPAAATHRRAGRRAAAAPDGASASAPTPLVHVRTDVLDLDIATRGGTLVRVDLPAYPKVKGESAPVRLENEDSAETLYVLQSGLTGPDGGAYPTTSPPSAAPATATSSTAGSELSVPLTWSEGGVTVTKTYTFRRGDYAIGVKYEVHNGGARGLGGARPTRRSCATTRPPSARTSTSRATPSTARRSGTAASTASSTSTTRTTATCRSTSRMAGWPRCSTTSSAPSCRRAPQP